MSMSKQKYHSFKDMSKDEIEAHCKRNTYGSLVLPDGIRPGPQAEDYLREGYKITAYKSSSTGGSIPVIMAAASREKLADLFRDLIGVLGDAVNIRLDSSFGMRAGTWISHKRKNQKTVIAESHFLDHENFLINDGYAGISMRNHISEEVQLDEHKLLLVYANSLERFQKFLSQHGILKDQSMRFITDDEHVHDAADNHRENFINMCLQFGCSDMDFDDPV